MKLNIFNRFFGRFLLTAGIVASLGGGMVSCSDDIDLPMPDPGAPGESGYITINLSSSELSTRTEEPGIDNLNENLINSVTLCMSPSAGDKTDDAAPAFMQTFTGLDAKGGVTLRIPLTMELRTRLFGENSSNTCNIFAAVNVDPGEAKTVADLRNKVVESTFASRKVQKNFTMDGDGVVSYTPIADLATADVKVKRSAAKFTLALALSEIEDTDDSGADITWKPNHKGMSVMLQQGVQTSQLDPKPEPNMDSKIYFNTSSTLNGEYRFSEDKNAPDPSVSGLKYKYDWVQETPLYSYPNKWTGGEDETHGTYLLLTIPWSCDEGKTYRTCYYHVPVVKAGIYETVRNVSYHINLHVAVLGSFVPEEPMEVEADYFAADWGTEDLEVDIKDYRYLVVDQNEFTVNNENEYSIPFYTSHPTKVISCTMTYYRYNFSDQGSEFAVIIDEAKNTNENGEKVFEVDFDSKNKVLNIKHDLDVYTPYRSNGDEVLLTRRADETRAYVDNASEISEMLNTISYYKKKSPVEAEYSRIKFEISVQHIDVSEGKTQYDKDKDYIEKITVWQYPGMYITAVQNYCGNLGASPEWVANGNLGNTIINGNTTDRNRENLNFSGTSARVRVRQIVYNYGNWDTSIGLGAQSLNYYNWNPNMYLVTITQLSQDLGEKYIIDDPRSYNINNELSNNNGSYTVDGGNNKVFANEYWYFRNENSAYKGNGGFSTPQTDMSYGNNSNYYNTPYVLTGFIKARALNETKERTLLYYYPTREAEENKNTLAPKFRICSSYAGTIAFLTREMSRRRAAAYQELGYCAGRWRLPTYGEVEYIMTLSAQEKIPRLFGTNSSGDWCYWCAQGAVVVPDGTSNNPVYLTTNPSNVGSVAVAPFTENNYRARARFVYDEWYWGSETLTPSSNDANPTSPIYTFTWGDKEKTNPEN